MSDLSGNVIKGYELRERIGAGGFGAVYRAFQSSVGREVAIKIILPHFASRPDFIRRFETEAQLVARLEHPFIVPLYDYWRDPEGAYLVMRWLRNGSLREALKECPFDLPSAARLLDQITSALATAHRNQVIHRDLKPANILLDEDGNAYLADFGIAKDLMNLQGGSTQADMVVGSPDYLAPEQARSELVTPQTDIYSLGITLYEVLTGQHPFPDVTPVERMYKHLNESIPLLPNLPPDVAPRLNEILQKATAKNPAHRYSDVLALAVAFREAVGLVPDRSGESVVELLTQREQAVLRCIIDGRSNKEIAEELFITVATVKWYIKQIYGKLNVRSRVQAIVRARELHLITSGSTPGESDAVSITVIPSEQFALENPYKGLRAFQSADFHEFFGRETLTEKLLKRFGERGDSARFLAVVGPSGSGKSSLVKAGLIPALWQGKVPGSERWFVVEMLPGAHPLDELEIALTRIAANQAGNLHEQLARDDRGLVRVAQLILPNDGSELVLIIDQFEEVFTLVNEEPARLHFLDLLTQAVTEPHSRVRVVITLRADFYDRPLRYAAFGELVRSRMETVLPLSATELERAIAQPAEQVGVSFEPGLISAIVSEVNYQPGALPLLQYALTELFERRLGRLLTHDAYQAIGGTVGALARRADEVYEGLDVEAQEYARQMFLRLVTLGEGVEDTRRRVPRSELLALAAERELMDDLIDNYASYRLLSLDNDPGTRSPMVEVAHEAMLREWTRLREWLYDNRNDMRTQRQLAAAAAEWYQAAQDASFLLRGARLDQLEGWVAETKLALTPKERAYLEASFAERERLAADETARQERELALAHQAAESAQQAASSQRRAANRLRYLVAGLAIFLLLTATLAIVAFNSRNDAILQQQNALNSFKQSESQRLAAESASALQRGDSPELAALLAIRGLQSQYTAQADAALQKASRPYYGKRVFRTPTRVMSVAFSPDGRYALTGSENETGLWDLQTGAQLHTFAVRNSGGLLAVTFSPDGRYVFVGSLEGEAFLWDAATGAQVRAFKGHSASIPTVAYSPDGRYVLTGSQDKTAKLWEAATGSLIRTFTTNANIAGVKFSPDGRRIAITTGADTAQVLDVETGSQVWSATIPAIWSGVAFSPDGHYLLVVTFQNKAFLLDASTGQKVREFVGHSGGIFTGEFSPDGKYVVTASIDQTARLWDAATGQEVRRFLGHTASVYAVAFSPDGRHILTGAKDATARLWDIQASPEQDTFSGAQGWIYGVAFSPDSKVVAVGANDAAARLFVAATGTPLRVITHPSAVQELIFSRDGKYLLTGNNDGVARLWDVTASGDPVRTFVDEGSISIAYANSGRYIATSGGLMDKATVWNALTGDKLRTFDKGGSLVFSPDGKYLAISHEDTQSVYLYEVETGVLLRTFKHPTNPLGVTYSPDGRYLVTGSRDNIVRLWDATTGQVVQQFVGHTNVIWNAAFSPDGKYILSGSQDKTARLWDAQTGQQIRLFPSHNFSAISQVAYSPDGRSVLIGSSDGTAQLADVELDTLVRSVCSRLLRDFTDDERSIYSIRDKNPTCSQPALQPTAVDATWTPVPAPMKPAAVLSSGS